MRGGFNQGGFDEATKRFETELAAEARATNSGDTVGEIVRFQIADGYASYMVWSEKPLHLIDVGGPDGYQIPEAHERGLRLSDIRDKVAQDRKWKQMIADQKKGA
jgi:hypothetical protein